jgi:hypothetical protein
MTTLGTSAWAENLHIVAWWVVRGDWCVERWNKEDEEIILIPIQEPYI